MAQPPVPPDGDYAALINQMEAGSFSAALGLRFTRATRDEVLAELTITERHHQPYGVVHGGVHASVIETLSSVGAGIAAFEHNKSVLGLENHTTFVRAVRDGTLLARATPITRGRRTQVWETNIRTAQGDLVASGRVRLLLLDPESQVAGRAVGFKGQEPSAQTIAAAQGSAAGAAASPAHPAAQTTSATPADRSQ